MRVAMVTREYPPHVYGGAGVHVAELSAALSRRSDTALDIHAMGDFSGQPGVRGYREDDQLRAANPALATMGVDLAITAQLAQAQVVHTHTWYAHLAGLWSHLLHESAHVATAHSLEPKRPWKAEQLGGGYRLSAWAEEQSLIGAQAVIAVSEAMAADIRECLPALDPQRIHVVHNGIDAAAWTRVDDPSAVAARYGVDPSLPTVLFIGRITRQKGITHLLEAASRLDPQVQLVLCASAADTPELRAEVSTRVEHLQRTRSGVVWIEEMVPKDDLRALLSCASLFVCPSVYEPLGIVNLEAMACGLPVVASAIGGIPEVVLDGETGLLVPCELGPDGEPADPITFAGQLASTISLLLADTVRAAAMGQAGRERAIAVFDWDQIAERTMAVYQAALR